MRTGQDGIRKLPTPKSQLHGETGPHLPLCGTINKPGASVGARGKLAVERRVRVLIGDIVWRSGFHMDGMNTTFG